MTVTEFNPLDPPPSDERRPPMSSACAPDIFNKLDAGTIERTRVVNTQLDVKLNVQEQVLLKYKNAAQQRFVYERARVRTDLQSIGKRLPNYADVPKLESEVAKLQMRRRRRHNCVFTTEPIDFRFATDRCNKPYCDRYFTHHVLTNPRYYSYRPLGSGSSAPEMRSRPADLPDEFPVRSVISDGGAELPVRPLMSRGSINSTGLPVRMLISRGSINSTGFQGRPLLSRGSVNSSGFPDRPLISRGSMTSKGLPDLHHMKGGITQSEDFPPDVDS